MIYCVMVPALYWGGGGVTYWGCKQKKSYSESNWFLFNFQYFHNIEEDAVVPVEFFRQCGLRPRNFAKQDHFANKSDRAISGLSCFKDALTLTRTSALYLLQCSD